jgi:hypothetical protein
MIERNKIMTWIDELPNVQETGFQVERDEIAKIMNDSHLFARMSEELRDKAAAAAVFLEGRARAVWTNEVVDKTKKNNI